MQDTKTDEARLTETARKWVCRDPVDRYRQHLLDAVLEHNGPEAWDALSYEMGRTP